MDVSENSGTPKSSILTGFSIINHPFWGTTIFGNTHILKQNISLANNWGNNRFSALLKRVQHAQLKKGLTFVVDTDTSRDHQVTVVVFFFR